MERTPDGIQMLTYGISVLILDNPVTYVASKETSPSGSNHAAGLWLGEPVTEWPHVCKES